MLVLRSLDRQISSFVTKLTLFHPKFPMHNNASIEEEAFHIRHSLSTPLHHFLSTYTTYIDFLISIVILEHFVKNFPVYDYVIYLVSSKMIRWCPTLAGLHRCGCANVAICTNGFIYFRKKQCPWLYLTTRHSFSMQIFIIHVNLTSYCIFKYFVLAFDYYCKTHVIAYSLITGKYNWYLISCLFIFMHILPFKRMSSTIDYTIKCKWCLQNTLLSFYPRIYYVWVIEFSNTIV